MNNNIVLVRVPEPGIDYLEALRDYILQSLEKGALVLPEDASCEVIELPPLGNVEVREEIPAEAAPEPEHPAQVKAESEDTGAEKRAIVQRLKDYRNAHGRGCLDKVSEKTAHRKGARISANVLRDIAADCAPKMELSEWRKIARALDALEAPAPC